MNTRSIDWVLSGSSTVYMDGRSVYHLRNPGVPGIKASLALNVTEYAELRKYLIENLRLEDDQ